MECSRCQRDLVGNGNCAGCEKLQAECICKCFCDTDLDTNGKCVGCYKEPSLCNCKSFSRDAVGKHSVDIVVKGDGNVTGCNVKGGGVTIDSNA